MKDRIQGRLFDPNQAPGSDNPGSRKGRPVSAFVTTFMMLFCLWVVLSGKLDFFHLSLGLLSCLMVTFISKDLIFPHSHVSGFFGSSLRFPGYIPWLLYKIFVANLHVLFLVFHPRMMDRIDPRIFRFQSRLKKDLSLVTFSNSITLTPGTITVYVSVNGTFTVHGLDQRSREGLPGEMEKRIAGVFERE
ncbi:MAG: Na+/H+ antiporter subunit E [Desulfobacteraceae bacterium]